MMHLQQSKQVALLTSFFYDVIRYCCPLDAWNGLFLPNCGGLAWMGPHKCSWPSFSPPKGTSF